MKVLLIGAGYCARRWLKLGARVGGKAGSATGLAATIRDVADAPRFAALGIRPVPFMASALRIACEDAEAVIVSVPPGEAGDPALALLRDPPRGPRRIVYLSTIGVYGDRDGGWIDESSDVAPVSGRSQARVAAEQGWLDWGERLGASVDLLRLAGIYGPGRNALTQLRAGTAKRIVKPGQVFNRIHVDDIVGAITLCLSGATQGGPLIVADDEPAPPQDVIAYAATLLGVAPPPEIPFAQADLSPMAASFYDECKRASNARLRALMGPLAFPTYREGLDALRAQGEGGA
jgi:nucleoside-diphosphate-sugar epimerase